MLNTFDVFNQDEHFSTSLCLPYVLYKKNEGATYFVLPNGKLITVKDNIFIKYTEHCSLKNNAHLSICLSVRLFVHLSIHLPIYLLSASQ